MDWNLAIERNRAALGRIVAMLVAMAELDASALTSPLCGLRGRSSDRASGSIVGREGRGDCEAIGVPGKIREASGGGRDTADTPTRQSDDRRPPHKGEVEPAFTLPRHLHRAILRLLRPAESAVRRLIIVMARGLVVTLAPPRPRKAKPASTFLRKPGGTGILMPRGSMASARPAPRTLALPLLDRLRPFRPRRPVANGIPRISLPGVNAPSPIALRRPPAPDDPLDATRLALRFQALGAALDDLPGQARRFARWRARKQAGRTRRAWPLRPGRPPGQRPANRRRQEVHEILHDIHGLAFDVLESPDTS
jgi:hypothetical protein